MKWGVFIKNKFFFIIRSPPVGLTNIKIPLKKRKTFGGKIF